MQVKDLTTEELKALIRETVLETIEEVLDDPDISKTLRPELKQQLLESRQRRTTGQRGIPAADVAQRFGLTWQ
jgi:ribosomal protein L29